MNQGSSGGILTTVFIVLLAIALFCVLFGAFLLVPLLVVIFGFVALLVAQRSASSSPRNPEKKDPDNPDGHA